MPDKAEYFRSLHRAPPVLVLPNAWDAATARVFEAAGFRAVATTSAGIRVVINARTDVFLRQIGDPSQRLDMAIARGNAYRTAGADSVFVPGVTDAPTIQSLTRGIAGPVNVLAVAGTPPVSELEQLGVARVSVGSGPMRASIALVHEVAQELKTHGTYTSYTARALPYTDLNDLMRR